ncbi:hypothetical protein KM043_001579 [Ampulex compressa]|nr:hypothetical protein KM043_001579 [Ampulex compressa]
MGNEKSALSGLEVDEKPVEITDFWIHKTANISGTSPQRASIFVSEPSLHCSASFGRPSPLEKAAKNLMLHRHPCILRYISSWCQGDKFFLATEEVKPLVQMIETQNTLQICIGLYSVLRALIFLHDKARSSHNNVCSSSIYVTSEGGWKLGGLEYLCRFAELTPTYLQKIRTYRYEGAISPDEDIKGLASLADIGSIDAYAFGTLAEDVLKLQRLGDVPGLTEFRRFCKENLQNADALLRSKLADVLQHSFFTHDFIRIHAFLEELPLKDNIDKETFFTNLAAQLRTFPEDIVAEQLGRLLLSRMVLLDYTAQKKLLPLVLKPKDQSDVADDCLFTAETFKSYLVPKLLQMFCIRDSSIRLVLLSHFKSFVNVFDEEELRTRVLPELLVGIKDIDNNLVCATLRALADVIPILGAATVIGGNRGKLFTDGRPNKSKDNGEVSSASLSSGTVAELDVARGIDNIAAAGHLPERPSPDGGEDRGESNFPSAEEEGTWSDWDAQEPSGDARNPASQSPEHSRCSKETLPAISSNSTSSIGSASTRLEVSSNVSEPTEAKFLKRPEISDISELDVKNSRSMISAKEEYDFFTDMEPVIKKTQILHVQQTQTVPKSIFDVKISNAKLDNVEETDGWDLDLSDWGSTELQGPNA